MERRREGSCEYSRRNNEARRCGKMTEFPVTFVSSSASEASSGSDDILCPPPGWKPENSSEFEASSGPDGILCPPPSSSQDSAEFEASSGSDDVLCPSQLISSQQQRNLNSLRNWHRPCVVVKDPHRPGTQLAVPKKVQSSNCAASANCSSWFSAQPWGVGRPEARGSSPLPSWPCAHCPPAPWQATAPNGPWGSPPVPWHSAQQWSHAHHCWYAKSSWQTVTKLCRIHYLAYFHKLC